MDVRVVVIVTLWALVGCGRDPILVKAEGTSASEGAAQGSGARPPDDGVGTAKGGAGPGGGDPTAVPPGSTGGATPGVGTPGVGTPGVGTPSDPPVPLGPDGQPLPGKAEPPAPGDPSVPPPGGTVGDPTVPPPGGTIGVPTQPPPGSGPPGATPGGVPGSGAPQGPTVTLSGVVVYPGWTKGKVDINVFNGDHQARGATHPDVIGMGKIDRPGAFTVAVAQNAGKVYVEASIDEDDDGHPGPLDPQGQADRFPVTVGTDPITGLTITLTRRDPPPGGKGQDF